MRKLSLIVITLLLLSCKSQDSKTKNEVMGKWKFVSAIPSEKTPTSPSQLASVLFLNNANAETIWTFENSICSIEKDKKVLTESEYTLKDNKLIIKFENGEEIFSISQLNSSTLIILDSNDDLKVTFNKFNSTE